MPDEQQLLDLIATSNQGVLAAVTRVGYPHLTNVLYVWDSAEKVARRVANAVERNQSSVYISLVPDRLGLAVNYVAGWAVRRVLRGWARRAEA